MNYRIGIKFLFTGIALIILSFCTNTGAVASDYQYKILDPKFNPEAEKIIEGTLPPVQEISPYQSKKGFDFGAFFAICALIVFPMFIISLAIKTFKEINEAVPGREEQKIGNIKIEPKEIKKTETESKKSEQVKPAAASNPVKRTYIKPVPQTVSSNRRIPQTANTSINKYFSSPVQKKSNPMLLNTSPLAGNKGLCLVEYNQKYSLIGYIDEEIFMLNQFDNVTSSEIRSRLSESTSSRDRYIVRLGDYKALVEVSDSKMNLLLEL